METCTVKSAFQPESFRSLREGDCLCFLFEDGRIYTPPLSKEQIEMLQSLDILQGQSETLDLSFPDSKVCFRATFDTSVRGVNRRKGKCHLLS